LLLDSIIWFSREKYEEEFMHDIDRTLNEFGSSEIESGEMEFEFEAETGFGQEIASPFNEIQEMELASELLTLNSEAELNYFLGNLIGKAASAARTFVSSPTGQALGGTLKQAAKKALPVVGGAIGNYFGGSSGANIGSRVGNAAGDLFGLEMEAMNQEDREFEVARRFVKFAGATVKRSAQTPAGIQPTAAVRQAAAIAAQRYLPILAGIAAADQPPVACNCGSGRSGHWYRRGRKIILVGI
jgi:uncharacterized protein (DUF697 family)